MVSSLAACFFASLHVAELALTEQRNFACLAFVRQHHHVFAGARHVGQTLDFDRDRWAGFGRPYLPASSSMARTRPKTWPASTMSPRRRVPDCTSRVVTGPLPLSRRASMTMPLAGTFDRRLQFQHFGLQQNGFEQTVDLGIGLGRYFDELGIATPFFRGDALRDQFLANALGVGFGFVDLVHRHHQRHTGSLGMVDGFDGLRHHAVVCCDDQHHDVGRLGAACTHGGKGFVTRRIEEGDDASFRFRRDRHRCAG